MNALLRAGTSSNGWAFGTVARCPSCGHTEHLEGVHQAARCLRCPDRPTAQVRTAFLGPGSFPDDPPPSDFDTSQED